MLAGDEIDQAQVIVDAERDAGVARACAAAARPVAGSTGECWTCFEPIPHPKRFCGPGCSNALTRRR